MRGFIRIGCVAFFMIFTLSAHPTLAATIHVPADQPTIQAGIMASVDGDLVLVAPGTYVENIDIIGRAITLQGLAGTDETIIDGAQSGSVVTFASEETEETVLDGFTLRNGSTGNGGGIYCTGASPTITNCTISENTADYNGGGIDAKEFSSITIMDCTITGNISRGGGGIRCDEISSLTITNCTITGNQAESGGGGITASGSGTIENCVVSNNSGDFGAGISGPMSGTIMNCAILNNSGRQGGGIYSFGGADPTITNCTISGNSASEEGGGIKCHESSATITNCIISGNSAREGGGIRCSRASPTITNCTITGNTGLETGGGIYTRETPAPIIKNSILWGNEAPQGHEIYVWSGHPGVSYSDVQGGWSGEGNVDADPLFAGGDEYRLDTGSPCVDAGDPDPSYVDACLPPSLGAERNDMGAYGGPGACGWCGDYDGDGFESDICGGPDCDDADIDFHPGAEELCDGRDTDCDGALPEDEADEDGDGWMICEGECNDTDPMIHPGTIEGTGGESCTDGIDNDCDGLVDTDPECGIVIHVPADVPTIQAGINAAPEGVLVLVAPGSYAETIRIEKAITVQSEGGPNSTVIDGHQARSVVAFDMDDTRGAVIDGFTIRNGRGTQHLEFATVVHYGGGIYCKGTSAPTITNCTITENTAVRGGGGGIYSEGSPTITNCTISGNSGGKAGGGIWCHFYTSPTITNCTITGNSCSQLEYFGGGGIYCHLYSSPTIANCTISGNVSVRIGGGISCDTSSPTITNCIISDNIAPQGWGAGIFADESYPTITHCTITGNSTTTDGAGGGFFCNSSFPTFTNCILWGNSSPEGPEIWIGQYMEWDLHTTLTVSYSDVQGGEAAAYFEPGSTLIWLEGNIDADPLFVGPGDYHLRPGSPCIDAGVDDGVYTDLDGDTRPYGAGFDLGADEFTGPRWTLTMDADFTGGILSMGYIIWTPEPATWVNYLIMTSPTVQIIPLWTIPLPVLTAPLDLPISFPFPSVRMVGFYNGLYSTEGLKVSDLDWVDTGS